MRTVRPFRVDDVLRPILPRCATSVKGRQTELENRNVVANSNIMIKSMT